MSSAGRFAFAGRWTYGWYPYYDLYLADVTGDRRAELVGRDTGSGGYVYVMHSTGAAFSWNGQFDPWTYGWGSTYDLLVKDATKDGKADLVGRNRSYGNVEVGTSTGTAFSSPQTWMTGIVFPDYDIC